MIEIQPGLTKTDLNGDGKEETLLKVWRENFNAHGYYVLMFLQGDASKNQPLSIIGIENKDEKTIESSIETDQGADCTVADYRIFLSGKITYLIAAQKPVDKDGYDALLPVSFNIYKLEYNEEGAPGTPEWLFKYIRTTQTKQTYCDVDEAFKTEEGLLANQM